MTHGVDLSDTVVRAVTVSTDGQIIAKLEQPGEGAAALRDALRFLRSHPHKPVEGVTERTRGPAGIAIRWPSDELPTDVAAVIAKEPLPPVIVAAGSAMVLAETWRGTARGLNNVVTVAIGEHVTAGIMVNGQVLHGVHGYAGWLDWLSLNPVEREDYRRFGGLGAEVSAAAIVRRTVWRIKAGDRSSLAEKAGGDFSRITAADVFTAAQAGDDVCISVVRDTVKYVGMAIANIAALLDPQAIVLEGDLAQLGEATLEAIRGEARRRVRPSYAEHLRIDASSLGRQAAAIGAARAAQLQLQ